MSALGQKQTFALQKIMSALPPKADMCVALAYVCFGPIADILLVTRSANAGGRSPRAPIRSRPCTSRQELGVDQTNRESQIDANDTDRTSFRSRMHCAEV